MIDVPWPAMLLVAGAYLGLLATGELVHRALRVRPEQSRKLDHAAAGAIALALPVLFDSPWPVLVLAAGFLGLMLTTRWAGLLRSVHGIRRFSAGADLYPVAVALCFLLADDRPEPYVIAIAALAFADAASGVVGDRWARRSYTAWGRPKSVEGSVAAFAVTAMIALVVLVLAGVQPQPAVLTATYVGVVVALVEGALPWGLDNLGVPLAALAALEASGSPVVAAVLLVGAVGLLRVAIRRPAGACPSPAHDPVPTSVGTTHPAAGPSRPATAPRGG